jgi:hypothetical protein
MKPTAVAVVFTLIAVGFPGLAAQDKARQSGNKDQQRIAEIQKVIGDTLIELKEPLENVTLAQFLAALEAQLPKDKKITVRIDEEAFGKDLPRIAGARLKLVPRLKNVSFSTILGMSLRKLWMVEELDYAIRPSGVVVTRPRLAAHSAIYSVGDVVTEIPLLLPKLRQESEIFRTSSPRTARPC